MNETAPQPATERRADDFLPPVEPPAATFIMQLFFIPLIIVSVIVGVWMLFSWIANLGTQPIELVNDIERLNHASWQKALTLANTLRDPRHDHLREDPALAGRVSSLLDQKLQSEQYDRDNLWLQIYLCRVLGEFNIDAGLPTLINALERAQPPEVLEVRRSALQAIGLLVDRIGAEQALANPHLIPALIEVSQTPDAATDGDDSRPYRLRSTAAFVLGLLDDPRSTAQLVELKEDAHTDVQFNAATGLARHGDQRAIPILIQMLNPSHEKLTAELDASLPEPEQQKWIEWKRNLIVFNALRAIQKLAEQNGTLGSEELVEAISQLIERGQVNELVRSEANQLIVQLGSHTVDAS